MKEEVIKKLTMLEEIVDELNQDIDECVQLYPLGDDLDADTDKEYCGEISDMISRMYFKYECATALCQALLCEVTRLDAKSVEDIYLNEKELMVKLCKIADPRRTCFISSDIRRAALEGFGWALQAPANQILNILYIMAVSAAE